MSSDATTNATANATTNASRNRIARLTGGLYAAYIAATVLGSLLAQIGMGSTEQVYRSAVEGDSFRLGFVLVILSGFLFLMAAWGLYVLLRPVNGDLALLFLLLNAVGVAVQGASMLPLIWVMLQGDSAAVQAFTTTQLQGLAYLSIDVYHMVFVTAQVFFCTWLFPLGYLVFKSGFLPRLLGMLLVLDGFAVAIWFLQEFLLPDYPAIRYPGLIISLIAEVSLALWLLIKGVERGGRSQRLTRILAA